jgi:hypothetical protein
MNSKARMKKSELTGGDRRSIGRANEVAVRAAKSAATFGQLIESLWHEQPVVRMRAADAAEKASAQKPQLLVPYKAELLGLLDEATQQELRWHLAQIVPRLDLTRAERHRAAAALREYMGDRSSIVKTFALQALADFAERDESLRGEVLELIRGATKAGTPAMRARGRMLLKKMDRA